MAMVFPNLPTDTKNEISVGSFDAEFTYPDGRPCAGLSYKLELSTGGTRSGTLDDRGRLHEGNVPPGAKGKLSLVGIPVIAVSQ